MCATCGCGQSAMLDDPHEPSLYHEHGHPPGAPVFEASHTATRKRDPEHGHDRAHPHDRPEKANPGILQVEKSLLAENDHIASNNRSLFNRRHIRVFSLISSPGAGKTTLLEQTLTALRGLQVGCAVIEGDQATDLDAQRIARTGVPVFQIETGRSCHLQAQQIQRAMTHLDMRERGLLFIENVGNLICPTEFKLGEHERITMLSTPEGHDKPGKYPLAFRHATAVVISKIDLLPYVNFDRVEARRVISSLNPKARIFEVSSTSGDGMDDWFSWLQHRVPARA